MRFGIVHTLGSAAMVAACSGAAPTPAVPPAALLKPPPPAPRAAVSTDAMASDRIALVPDGTFGPYVGSRHEGTIAAWASEIAGKRSWMTVAISEDATRLAEPKTVADAAAEVDLVAIKPLGEGDVKEFVLVSSSREFSGERVDAMALGSRGELLGGPAPLAQSLSDVVWLDAVPTHSGALVFWAVRHDDRASLFSVAIGPGGDARSEPAQVLGEARAWQVSPVSGGVAIAAVTAGKSRGESGPLRVVFVDETARVEKKSLVVVDGATAEPDVDLARVGDKLVVAWSDRREGESRLYGAVVSSAGAIEKPAAPLVRPFGPQVLLRLVPPSGRGSAFIAWENLLESASGARAMRVATIGDDGTTSDASAVITMASADSVPELATTEHGLAGLTLAPACLRGTACERERVVPTFVTIDRGLDVVASEPLRLAAEGGAAAELAWGLTCRGDQCLGLATSSDVPTPVLAVSLAATSDKWAPAARRANSDPPPRATSIAALGKTEPVAELVTTKSASGSLVAWVTDFDPTAPYERTKIAAPDGKFEAPRAVVRVRSLPDRGPPADPVALSYRAHSVGGVALASASDKDETLLAWVGIDNKEPEVFVTLLGPGGKKISQKMLTHAKGGVADVSVAFVSDGWVVGWVEDKGGASEVHVERVDRSLKPASPSVRLGGTASTATSIQLLARGEHVIAVWSDARGQDPGVADVFGIRLSAKDLSPVGSERRLAQTPGHSRSPAIAAFGEGAVVAWIESPPGQTSGAPGSVMVMQLDSGGEPVAGTRATVALPSDPKGLGVACDHASCRIVLAATVGEGGAIDAFEWRPEGTAPLRRLVRLAARQRDTIAPAVLGDEVFYADEIRPTEAWLRRMTVAWQ